MSEPGIETAVRKLATSLQNRVEASLNGQDGDGHLGQLRYQISSKALVNMEDFVDKVQSNRYDAALYDALRALVTVYSEPDHISVKL